MLWHVRLMQLLIIWSVLYHVHDRFCVTICRVSGRNRQKVLLAYFEMQCHPQIGMTALPFRVPREILLETGYRYPQKSSLKSGLSRVWPLSVTFSNSCGLSTNTQPMQLEQNTQARLSECKSNIQVEDSSFKSKMAKFQKTKVPTYIYN